MDVTSNVNINVKFIESYIWQSWIMEVQQLQITNQRNVQMLVRRPSEDMTNTSLLHM